jgi:hypothetical protein
MKVAKLVAVSFLTRVIVDQNATEEETLEIAKKNFAFKLEDELSENIDYIIDDLECPFDEKHDL